MPALLDVVTHHHMSAILAPRLVAMNNHGSHTATSTVAATWRLDFTIRDIFVAGNNVRFWSVCVSDVCQITQNVLGGLDLDETWHTNTDVVSREYEIVVN